MKRFLLLSLLLCISLPASAADILLKDGTRIPPENVLSKNQFGIMVAAGTNKETGDQFRRFIPFTQLNPASLAQFPFCDVKAVERISLAVQDRADLIREKFAPEIAALAEVKDFSKSLTIHSGVSSYQVLFIAEQVQPDGLIGTLYSDSADSVFYGRIFLYGLIGGKDVIWVGEIYPENDRTRTIGGYIYREFTVIPPPPKPAGPADENAPDKRRPRKENAGDRGGNNASAEKDKDKPNGPPDGEMPPPPPPQDGKMPPLPKDGKMPPPPPQGGKGGRPNRPPPGGGGMPHGGAPAPGR